MRTVRATILVLTCLIVGPRGSIAFLKAHLAEGGARN